MSGKYQKVDSMQQDLRQEQSPPFMIPSPAVLNLYEIYKDGKHKSEHVLDQKTKHKNRKMK